MVKKNDTFEVNADYRMKVINFLKIYGYYKGVLVRMDVQRRYISGEYKLVDIIKNKKDYKELKMSAKAAISYCRENNFDGIGKVMEYFYKVECLEIKKLYGSILDRL